MHTQSATAEAASTHTRNDPSRPHVEPEIVSAIFASVDQAVLEYRRRRGLEMDPMCSEKTGLLRLLTYCYATGLYGSEEIETTLRTSAMHRWLAAGALPEAGRIRSFRRHHGALVVAALATLLRSVHRAALAGGGRWSSLFSRSRLSGSLHGGGPDGEREADWQDEAQAQWLRAVRADSAALDE